MLGGQASAVGLDVAVVDVETVKDLLLRRLRDLGDDCRQALSVAAVAGREFELPA